MLSFLSGLCSMIGMAITSVLGNILGVLVALSRLVSTAALLTIRRELLAAR